MSWTRRFSPLALALVLCAPPARTHAQQVGEAAGGAREQASEPPVAYRELIDQALAESAASRFQEAGALFRRAHALYPNARALRGIGMVAFELRDYVDAARHLQLSLAHPTRPLDAAQRSEVAALLDRSLAFVARYDTSGLPGDRAVYIDGQRSEPEPDGSLLVGLGKHLIEVRSGTRQARAEVVVRGGEREPLPLLLPVDAAPPVTAELAAAQAPSAPTEQADTTAPAPGPAPLTGAAPAQRAFPVLSTVAASVGGALMVVGTVLLVRGMAEVRAVEDAQDGTEWATLSASQRRAPRLTGAGIGLLSTGAVLGGLGVVGLTLHTRDDDGNGQLDALNLEVRSCF